MGRGTAGTSGSWWHRPSRRSSEETHIGVPDRIGVPGRIIPGTVEWRSVIGSLADYEKRSFEEIAETIRVQFVDVTEFGIAGDFTMAGPILLSAGASFLSSARGMLRAAATAAVRPRADIGNFSTVANRIADQARLGYTRAGSYVIPLLMPLPPPQDDSARQPLEGMGTERVAYEPAERRVTRTLCSSRPTMALAWSSRASCNPTPCRAHRPPRALGGWPTSAGRKGSSSRRPSASAEPRNARICCVEHAGKDQIHHGAVASESRAAICSTESSVPSATAITRS